MAEDTSGVVVASLALVGIGVFVVDKAMSPPGESWFDKLTGHGPEPEEELAPQRDTQRPAPRIEEGPGFFERLAQLLHGVPLPPKKTTSVRDVQLMLNSLPLATLQQRGLIPSDVHLPLNPDGVLGKDTTRVLAAVQSQLGLPATGRLDDATIGALSQKAVAPKALPPKRVAQTRPSAQRPPTQRPTMQTPPVQYYRAPSPEDYARLTPSASMCPPGTYFEPRLQSCVQFPHAVGADVGDWKTETASLGSAAQDIIGHALDQESNARVLLGLSRALENASFPIASAAAKAKASSLGGATKTGIWGDPAPWRRDCLPYSAWYGDFVGAPPGYEGGPAVGSCPPGTAFRCVPPPPTSLTGGELAAGYPAGYEGGPYAGMCPPGTKPDCMPPPAQLTPLTGYGRSVVGFPPPPMWRPDFALLVDPEEEFPCHMGWW